MLIFRSSFSSASFSCPLPYLYLVSLIHLIHYVILLLFPFWPAAATIFPINPHHLLRVTALLRPSVYPGETSCERDDNTGYSQTTTSKH